MFGSTSAEIIIRSTISCIANFPPMTSRKRRPALERAATGWCNRRLGNQLAENRIQVFVTVEVLHELDGVGLDEPVVSAIRCRISSSVRSPTNAGTGRFREDLVQLAWRKVRAALPRSPSDGFALGDQHPAQDEGFDSHRHRNLSLAHRRP